eukprot:3838312-Prymnesium_polylepis.1
MFAALLRRPLLSFVVALFVLTLNLYYPLFALLGGGGPLGLLVEGLASSRALLTGVNGLWLSAVGKAMLEGGIPSPNRTVQYGSTGTEWLDVYDFARPVTLVHPPRLVE